MGRLKKGIELLGSEDAPPTGYRCALVDWLNRALSASVADREAAERVGKFINNLNERSAKLSDSERKWIRRSPKAIPDGPYPNWDLKHLAPDYQFQFDVFSWWDGFKWALTVDCVKAPSDKGDGSEFEPEAPELGARWDDGEQGNPRNPERQAALAVLHIALVGRLGTIMRCEVPSCRKWFVSKRNDLRRRCCPEHDSDELRKGTAKRKKQINEAQKRAREREKRTNEKYWKELKEKDGLERPRSHRAQK